MRKRSQRERTRWEHYRIRGSIRHAKLSMLKAQEWAKLNGYLFVADRLELALSGLQATENVFPTHPSKEYLERNS